MKPSQTKTTSIPANTGDGVVLATAADVPLRVMVRAYFGGDDVAIGYELNDVNQLTSGIYILPAGNVDIFVLGPGQALYAKSYEAQSTRVSVAISEAFPIK